MPTPDRSYFEAHAARYCFLDLRPCGQVRGSYSCPYRCSFCYRHRLNAGRYRTRPIADVVADIVAHPAPAIFIAEFGTAEYDRWQDRLLTDDPERWDYLHLVARPTSLSVRRYALHYYWLMAKLFWRSWRQGTYRFLNYGGFARLFATNLVRALGGGDGAR